MPRSTLCRPTSTTTYCSAPRRSRSASHFRSTLMFTEPGFGLASFVQRVGRVSRGADDGQVIVSLPESARGRQAWTRRIVDLVEQHDELNVQEFTAQILRDVRRRLEPTQREADAAIDGTTLPFYRRASWRGAFWAALFVVAIRRTKMKVQKEANARLRDISPSVMKFVDAKIGGDSFRSGSERQSAASDAAAQAVGRCIARKRSHLPRHRLDDRRRESRRHGDTGHRNPSCAVPQTSSTATSLPMKTENGSSV